MPETAPTPARPTGSATPDAEAAPVRLRRDLRRERAQRTGEAPQGAVPSASAAEVSDERPLPADAFLLPAESAPSAPSDGKTALPARAGDAGEPAGSEQADETALFDTAQADDVPQADDMAQADEATQGDEATQPGDATARKNATAGKAASSKARRGRRRASRAVPPVPRPGSRSSAAPARPAADAARPRSGAGRTTTVGAAFAIVALVCGTTLPVSAALVHADDKGNTTTAAAADIRAQSFTADGEILPEVRISGSYTATTPEELRDIRAAEAAMAKSGVASIAKPGQVIQPLTAGSYTLTDGFGAARSGRSHMGQDYAAAIGTPIYAVADGVVSLSQESYQGYGVTVQIEHPGLGGGQAVSTLYSHMQYGSRAVEVGDRVTAGQFLGYVGNTGWIVGSCLHLEVHINGTAIDPLPWMEANVR